MEGWLRRPLPGWRYAAAGVALAAVKLPLDYAIARAYGHPYSILFYVSPIDAPLMHPGADFAYFLTLASLAIPFIAAGVALTARRLHDAAMSPWFALFFFVPFANLLFFLGLALIPSRPRAKPLALPADAVYRELGQPRALPPPPPHRRYPRLVAGVLGATIALGAFALSVGALQEYGVALMLGIPTITGFATGAFYARLEPGGRFKGAAVATVISMAVAMGVCLVFAVEGLGCLVMFFPLFALPGFLGSFIGWSAAGALPPRRTDAAIAASLLSFFALLAAERVSPLPPLLPPAVETSMEIDAPPERVWAELPSMPDMPPTDDWVLRNVVAYPVRATLQGQGVGARRTCDLTTGPTLETVDEWAPPRAFGFTVDVQPDPMRELTLYRTVRQPHLDGYVRNRRGEFALEALPGGRTRLTGRSWYTVRIAPESYWRWWSDFFIHRVHTRVMRVVKDRAERKGEPRLVERDRPPPGGDTAW
jgi:Protein of unknown function (DUF805)/Polyketide cyclase / dehydrase and lipid transport